MKEEEKKRTQRMQNTLPKSELMTWQHEDENDGSKTVLVVCSVGQHFVQIQTDAVTCLWWMDKREGCPALSVADRQSSYW